MKRSTLTVRVNQEDAADVAAIINKRLTTLQYDHTIEVDEATQIDQALERERQSAIDTEEQRAERTHAHYLGGYYDGWDVTE